MENNPALAILKSKAFEQDEGHFRYYARPLTARLLETMELAKDFKHGEGDYLYYEKNGKTQRVLDLTGGYGANLLGHRNPRIMAKLKEWHDDGAPNLTQGSVRSKSGLLAKRISDTLEAETSEGPWITTFSNSGTEAVEAALKHCLIYFKHKLIGVKQGIEKEMNLSLVALKRKDEESLRQIVRALRLKLQENIEKLRMAAIRQDYFLHQLANCHSIDELVALVREINELQLSTKPIFLSLEKSYHGKTMGALSLTSSRSFRTAFYLGEDNNPHTKFISQYIDPALLEEIVQDSLQDLVVLSLAATDPVWTKQSFSLIAGAFAEPIQGEAGIVPVSPSFLALLKKFSLQEDFLLVFDEIQAGTYRTGTMASGSHTYITPDIYTFSKSLGGGVAKIAATSILQRKYIEEFGLLHTSTFAEDDLSSTIALEVLDILQGEGSPLNEGMRTADYLWARLHWLKDLYPEAIKDVRGKGLMLAIEFHDLFPKMGFEFKTICDAFMQGYLIASALLNHENLRMNPSLSNQLTLRIQPSVYFSIVQAEELIRGLITLCEALKTLDVGYFLSAIYPEQVVHNIKTPDLITEYKPGVRPLAVFLCHLIDEGHVKKVTRALKDLSGKDIVKKLTSGKDLAEFSIYHAQTIKDNNGKEMDIIMMGISLTSEELKRSFLSRNKYKVVQKVQSAIDLAKELGASTVGLGQFTSIISGNGLYLNPRGMNLTTGNAFTISLTVQSALRSAAEKNVELKDSTVALIGAAGNIMSVATSLMADHVGKIIMLHHSPIESSLKYQEATKRILSDISTSDCDSRVVSTIKRHWSKGRDLLSFLAIPEVKEVFLASSEIRDIRDAEIVLCGASASSGFIDLEQFKQGAVIVDVAVPPSIRPEMLSRLNKERPDLTYHMGGVARVPKNQNIDLFLFPLEVNECYACMAETFSIGLSGRKNFLNIGDLNKSMVMEVQQIADQAGFVLGSYKSKSSL